MAALFTSGKFQAIGATGVVPGARLYTYAAGTLTPLATFTDQGGLSPNANPVVCDANGQASVWLGGGAYRFILKNASDVTVYDVDNITTDAAPVYFLQTGTGSVSRTVQARLADSISVTDFLTSAQIADIKANTGLVDVATGFQAALSAAISLKLKLLVPAGTYRLSAKLTGASTAFGLVIEGDGSAVAQLVWDSGANAGLDLTYSAVLFPPKVSGLSLQVKALATAGSTALKITGPEAASVQVLGPKIKDIEIRGQNVTSHAWDVGMNFVTCWYIVATEFHIKGQDNTFVQTAGIKLTGCQVCWIDRFTIFHLDTGILEVASGGPAHGEGFCFSNFEMVGINDGINLSVDGTGPGTNIGPGHINSNRYGVKLANQYSTKVHDLLLYQTQTSTVNYFAIQMTDCSACHIHDNQVEGNASAVTGNTTGILLTGSTLSDENQIHDNHFRFFFGPSKTGIILGTGAGGNNVHDNQAEATVTAVVSVNSDAEKTNRIHNNYPAYQVTLPTGATPSVGNWGNGGYALITANSGATNITNFADGQVGQEITVVFNEANTTLTDTATISLGGNTSLTGSGALMRLQLIGTVWYELSRRAA